MDRRRARSEPERKFAKVDGPNPPDWEGAASIVRSSSSQPDSCPERDLEIAASQALIDWSRPCISVIDVAPPANALTYPLLEELLRLRGLPLLPSYTNREVATVFGASLRSIEEWICSGKLVPRDMPGRKSFLPIDLEELLSRRRDPKQLRRRRDPK